MTAPGGLIVCGAGLHPMADANAAVRADGRRHCLRCAADRRRESRAAGRAPLPVFRPPAWMASAACATSGNPDAWFPEQGGGSRWEAEAVRRVCAACPVRAECLDYAIAHKIPEGIWGGLAPRPRRAEAKRRAALAAEGRAA